MAPPAKKHRLPKHFSMISAQTGPVHDQAKHDALGRDIKQAGLRAHEAEGMFDGVRERSFMVEHPGSNSAKAFVDALGKKYGQHSVIHSDRVSGQKGSIHANELRFSDGSPSAKGMGHWQGDGHIKGDHSVVNGVGFRLHVEEPREQPPEEAHDPRFSDAEEEDADEDVEKSAIPQAPHSDAIRSMADAYAGKNGMKLQHGDTSKVNPERAGKIAMAYEGMKHEPGKPEVKGAYDALKQETLAQYKHLKANGLKISRMEPGMESPYKNSSDMARDVRENKHLWYYPTEHGFGSGAGEHADHPMLEPTGEKHEGKPLLANDAFRIVHDVFGHAKEGHTFGPQGEERAWREHMQMYSPAAQKALTAETRGQNSWVNFGPHGAHNKANPGQTKYAEQKAGILPGFAHDMGKSEDLEKAPLVFEADEKEPHREVWRMQNAEGEGPYQEASRWGGHEHGSKSGHPAPGTDPGFTDKDRKTFASSVNTFQGHKFGFEHEHQLHEWFRPHEKEKLGELGYHPTKVKAKKIWSSGKQVFFEPHEEPVKKAEMMHEDGASLTGDSHALASMSLPMSLKEWGSRVLSPLDKDAMAQVVMAGHRVKVRKLGPDLYSGWTERGDEIRHKFSRVTMPELMSQLQSQLEMYGKETEVAQAAESKSQAGGTSESLKPSPTPAAEVSEHTAAPGHHDIKIGDGENDKRQIITGSEADKQAQIREKLETLRDKVKAETIPAADLKEGLENPETECAACGEKAEECSCYEGLSQPRVEFDLNTKKLTVFFKSDWNSEDKDNFKQDLKSRVGIILKKQDDARDTALEKAQQLIVASRRTK